MWVFSRLDDSGARDAAVAIVPVVGAKQSVAANLSDLKRARADELIAELTTLEDFEHTPCL